MTKIGSIHAAGHPVMVIYYDDKADRNPYRVCLEWYEAGRKKRKQIERYADLNSCGEVMLNYTRIHNEEKRPCA